MITDPPDKEYMTTSEPITKERISKALHDLLKMPMWSAGRAADLQWFQFGSKRTVEGLKGPKEVGEFALHVQCAWRISSPDGIIAASRDRYYPAGDPDTEPGNFRWDIPGANRCDERIENFFASVGNEYPVVESFSTDSLGGFSLFFSAGYRLDVFPDDSLEGEHWRLFQPYSNKEHFVSSGTGISLE